MTNETKTATLAGIDLKAIATLRHACPERPKEEFAAILNSIQVEVSAGNSAYTARATDRYVVGEMSGALSSVEGGDFDFCVDARELEKFAKGVGNTELVSIEVIEGETEHSQRTVKLSTPDMGISLSETQGTFPAVARLFPKGEPDGSVEAIALSPNHLTRLSKVHAADTLSETARARKDMPFRFRFLKSEHAKHAPVLIDRRDSTFRALIQPNILVGEWRK